MKRIPHAIAKAFSRYSKSFWLLLLVWGYVLAYTFLESVAILIKHHS